MGAQESIRPDVSRQLLMSKAQVKQLLEAQRRDDERKFQEEAFITAQRKLQEEAATLAAQKKLQEEALIAAHRKLQEEAANLAAQRKLQEEAFIAAQRQFQEEVFVTTQRKLQEEAAIAVQSKLQEEAASIAAQKKLQEETFITAQKKLQEETATLAAKRKLQEEAFVAAQRKIQEETAKAATQIKQLQEEAFIAAQRKFQEEPFITAQRKQQEKSFFTATTLQEVAAKRAFQEEAAKKYQQEEVAMRAFQEAAAKKTQEDEAAKRAFHEEAVKRQQQEETAKRAFQEEAAKRKQQEEVAKRAFQEEAAKRKQQEEAAKKKQQEEVAERAFQEAAAKKKQEEETAKRAFQEQAAKRKQQEEAAKRAFQEEAAKIKQQEEAAKKKQQEEAAERAFQEAAAKRKQKEEAAKKKQQEETDFSLRGTLRVAVGQCSYLPAPVPVPRREPFPRSFSDNRPRELPRNADVLRYCSTCYTRSIEKMFKCENGHGSCYDCKSKGRACGICRRDITNWRSYYIENHCPQTKVPCPHAWQGCVLHIKRADMENHVQECPFKKHDCPLGAVFGNCRWFGQISNLPSHFADMHPNNLLTKVGSELHLRNIHRDCRYIRLVCCLGKYFILHLIISQNDCKLYMAVQLIGTKLSARKWLYEIHVYNKSETRRKYMFTDTCRSSIDDMDDVFRSRECAVLPLWYANTFFNNEFQELNFKFFIMSTYDNRRGFNINQRGRD